MPRSLRHGGRAALTLALAAGCAGPPVGPPYTVVPDLSYVAAARDRRSGDLYLPAGLGRRPAVLIVHGGSWVRGSREQMAKFADRFARAGYVAFNIDYRLAPDHRFPAQLEDLRAALAWLADHADSFGIDPERIAAIGYSAGGHLVLLLGLAAGDGEPVPRAVVAGAAPSDLRQYPNSPSVAALLGGVGDERSRAFEAASPITHVSPDDPPVFLYHGALDSVVRVEQSRQLHQRLLEAGVPAELVEERWSGHSSAYLFDGDAFAAALAFLDAQMR